MSNFFSNLRARILPYSGQADVTQSATSGYTGDAFLQMLGSNTISTYDAPVSVETALSVPAISCAVRFLAETLASLPARVYQGRGDDRKLIDDHKYSRLLSEAVNDGTTGFDFRELLITSKLTHGRGLAYIERDSRGQPRALFNLDATVTTCRRRGDGLIEYEYGPSKKVYPARDIIDVTWMRRSDGFSHRSPILSHEDAIGKMIATTKYGRRYFAGGGMPPIYIIKKARDQIKAETLRRVSDAVIATLRRSNEEGRYPVVDDSLEIKDLPGDPERAQLTESQLFNVTETARIYNIPPTFLHDLTHATYSNAEQQDLALVKHTVTKLAEQLEQELSLKLFGFSNPRGFRIELDVDYLLRGDFVARMTGSAQGVQNGIFTPNEARRAQGLGPKPNGDDLMIQGATVPIGSQPNVVGNASSE